MSHKTKFLNHTFWASFGTGTQVVSQVLAIVILARILSPHEFGVASTATLVTQLFVIFCDFGVAALIVQKINLDQITVGSAKTLALLSSIVFATLLWACSAPLSRLFETSELEKVLHLYVVQLVLLGITAVHDAKLQREMNYRYLAMADTLSFFIGYFAVSIICAYNGLSFWSLAIGHICQTTLRCGMILVKSSNLTTFSSNKKIVLENARFGLGQTLSRLGSFLASQADSYIVSSRLGTEAMGFYGRANQLATMPAAQIGQIFDKLLFPIVSRQQQDKRLSSATYVNAVGIIMLLSLPTSILLYLTAGDLVPLVLGANWHNSIEPMRILACAIPFRMLHKVSDPIARAMGKTYRRAWRQWVVALFLLISAYGMSQFGLAGVAYAVVMAAILDALMLVGLCCSATQTPYFSLLKAMTPASIAAIATLLTTLSAYELAIVAVSEPADSALLTKLSLSFVGCAIVVFFSAYSFKMLGFKHAKS